MTCRNCGREFDDTFCSHCGEKKFDEHQLHVKHFAGEAFEGLMHFDNKFLRSVKTLITRPGQLSLDYTEGKTVRFMKPLQLFLVINLIFFFLSMHTGNLFSLGLQNYITYRPFTDYNTKAIVADKIKEKHLTLKEYEQVFNEQIRSDSKEFIFIFIPFYGLLFTMLFFTRKKLFVEHLMFSIHFVAFVVLYFFMVTYLITIPFYVITKIRYSQDFDNFIQYLTIASFFIYLFFGIRKFYRSSIVWSIICSLLIAGTFFIFIQYYRMMLFGKIVYLG